MRFSAHLGYLFQELPFERRFVAARQAGFAAVEHPAPYALPAARITQLLRDEGLAFAQIGLSPGDPAKGEKGLACLPGRDAEFEAALRQAIDYAAEIGSPFVHPQSGVAPAGVPHEELWSIYLGRLEMAVDLCAAQGLRVLVEPITAASVPGYLLCDFDLGAKARAALGPERLSLFFDTYHAAVLGIDPAGYLSENADAIGHIHVADHPGRHEPGSGSIDFEAFFAAVEQSRYRGPIGCEYVPAGKTADGLGWMGRYAAVAAT